MDDFYKYHKTHPDAISSAVDAVMHGTDLECGVAVYKTLVDAVKNGLLKEEQLDVSLKRLFMIRFRLGMFDPVSMVKYAQTPESVLDSEPHKAHALKMAQQSIVLLKNSSMQGKSQPVLPLSKNIKKIAVIGPNADNKIAVLGNYNGIPSSIATVLDGIKNKLGKNAEVIYEKAINFTNDTLLVYADVNNQYQFDGKPGFKAEYFSNKELEGTPAFVRQEKEITHAWQEGQIVAGNIKANDFSARFTTQFTPVQDGLLTFELEADDGYRFFVNDSLVVDAWTRNRWGTKQHTITMQKNKPVKLVLEYTQGEGKANVALRAGTFKTTNLTVLANRLKDVDAFIFAGGISPQLEGEEMKVDFPGFNGGDRTTIMLPAIQTELMKALQATGKPVVFVMMTGSAIAIPWEDENIPAILNAWYGGQSAGTAIADVLFGDYNPAGRLPVTFYKSDNDLPGFSDYSMNNRTYRYFNGEPLYPFGHGLSYSSFIYKDLSVNASSTKRSPVPVSLTVTNTGKMDGDEVVQLYVSHKKSNGIAPVRSLKGFQRVFLKAGESRKMQFMLSPEDLSIVNEKGELIQEAGEWIISVGGGQPGVNRNTTSNSIQQKITIR